MKKVDATRPLEPFALKLSHVSKVYKNGLRAVEDINLAIHQGDFFALLGPNGAGKSTTIGMISHLITKTAGRIEVMGIDFDQNRAQAKAMLGIVPQELNLNGFEHPRQILIQQAGYYGIGKKTASERADYYLEALGLLQKAKQPCLRLSGGMKRRLMIARALIHEPKVLLLDEPTAGVDVEIRKEMWEFLSEIRKKTGLSIVLTTHYLEEAENLCNRVAILQQGKIIIDTSMSQLLRQLESETLVLYLAKKIKTLPEIDDLVMRKLDDSTLEIELKRQHNISEVFAALAREGIVIHNMRNKANRLEQLFVNVVQKHKENRSKV